MTTTTRYNDSYLTQSELASMTGRDRTTIRAYHSNGLRYRSGPRKTNEYHCSASVCWVIGYELSKHFKLALVGVEPLALHFYAGSLEPHGPKHWIKDAITLGTCMGYSKSECHQAANKIKCLVSSGKIRSGNEKYSHTQIAAATIESEQLRLVSERVDALAIKNKNTQGGLIESELVKEFANAVIANTHEAFDGLAGRMANEVAREDDPAKCREILKIEIVRARTQYTDSFEQLSQSFEDRANSVDDSQAAA